VTALPQLHSPTHDTSPLVLHCPGLVEKRHPIWPRAWQAVSAVPRRAWPAARDLSILTWSDQPRGSTPFERCLDQLGIPYTTLAPEPGTRWVNYLKLPLAWAALDAVRTRYTMACDAADVLLFGPPAEIVRRFRALTEPGARLAGCKLLFAAERNQFPRARDQRQALLAERRMAEVAGELPFCHLNSGFFIGETEACRTWLTRAMETKRSRKRPFSDQAVWRALHVASRGEIAIDRRWEIAAVCAGQHDPADIVRLSPELAAPACASPVDLPPQLSGSIAPRAPRAAAIHFVLLTTDYPPYSARNAAMGGIGTWMRDLADGLARCDQRVTVLAPATEIREDLRHDNAQVFETLRFDLARWRWYRSVYLLQQLRPLREPGQRTVLVACTALLARRIRRVARWLSLETGAIVHGNDVLRATRSPRIRAGLGAVDWVVANSRRIAELTAPLLPSATRLATLHPFLNPCRFPPIAAEISEAIAKRLRIDGRRVLLSAGRVTDRKNHSLVLAALPAVLERFPDAVYVIAGDGPARERLEQEVARRGLTPNVVFTGFVSQAELRALYERADSFLMPSLESGSDIEGFGIVFLEAGYFRTPVIGSRKGGIPEAIEDGRNGLLVSGDDAAELGRALVRLLGEPALRERLAEQGHCRVMQSFTTEPAIRAFLEFTSG
jgi:phosphatidylinositol alpha-1,6-mannosyltransferase